MRKYSKRTIAAVAVVTLTGSGLAYAFWSAGGSGTAESTTGSTVALEVVQLVGATDLAPGLDPETLSGTFNNGNDGPIYVSTVTASIDSVVQAVGAPAGTCDATDYTLANETMTVDAEVAAGNAQGTWSGATLAFNNKAVNQDACKGATVTIAYAIS